MEKYDYQQAVYEDVKEYIENEINLTEWKGRKDDLSEKLYDDLVVTDSVTGNGSGSYTFSRWQAEENLCHNNDLLFEAIEMFCANINILEEAEHCDVLIRCYLLGQTIDKVLDELEENGELAEE